jgi:two-component system, OmpR family, response regulator MtrA
MRERTMCSLLLVEDDEDIRQLLTDLLQIQGHEVRVALDGIEALKQLDDRFPQLVISDIEMPALDGPALIHRMFVEDLGRENVPVILMSASPRLAQVAQAAGTPYALAKPFSVDALEEIVTRAASEGIPPRPPGIAPAFSSLGSGPN